MPLPNNYISVALRGSYVDLLGNPVSGSVTFTPTFTALTDPSALTVVVGRAITATLSGGAFTVSLPATDDPSLSPINFTYTVVEAFNGLPGRTYSISVPMAAAGTGLDISTLAFVASSPGIYNPGALGGGSASSGTNPFTIVVGLISSGLIGGGAGGVSGAASSLVTVGVSAAGSLGGSGGLKGYNGGYNGGYGP